MFQAIYKTVLLYLILFAAMRLVGKRQLGQMEPTEFVVTMLVANLASIPIENPDIPISHGLIAILSVVVLEMIFSTVALHCIRFRRILCGKPVILMENGKFLQDNMRKNRVTLDELISQLREKDIMDPQSVQYAILETGGNLSVFPYPQERPASAKEAGIATDQASLPITIVTDGKIYPDNLQTAGKDRSWIDQILRQHNTTLKDTFLLTVDKQDKVFFLGKEEAQ